MSTRLTRRVLAKTADYTIVYPMDAPGTVFTNRGASGTVNFTLPAPSAALRGAWYRFKVTVAQTLLVKTATADTLIAHNDATADSVSANTIGAEMEAFCDGTSWFVSGFAAGPTYTVAT